MGAIEPLLCTRNLRLADNAPNFSNLVRLQASSSVLFCFCRWAPGGFQ